MARRLSSVIAVVAAMAVMSQAPALAVETPSAATPAITVKGDQVMRGGQPWWFLGYNSFVWSGDCGNDNEKMTAQDVEKWFAGMRHDGHGAARLFFFNGWNTNRLDAAVKAAKKNNIYLMITLDDAIAGCGTNEKDTAWFDNQENTSTFQNHMTKLLKRYKGENTIAWFEYFNEPDYADGKLRAFYDRMGKIADTIDPKRLFSSGTVAPYWLDGDQNYRTVHQSPGVDIASLHEYDGNETESNHGPGARANSAGKPVIVGEFGINGNQNGDGCDYNFTTRAQKIAAKANAYTSNGYAGALAWAWQPGTGNSTCDTSNLDTDSTGQKLLRTFRPKGD